MSWVYKQGIDWLKINTVAKLQPNFTLDIFQVEGIVLFFYFVLGDSPII